MNKPKIEPWIYDFVKAICPEAPELYLSMFNEKVAITDATRIINELTSENAKLKVENRTYHDSIMNLLQPSGDRP